MSAVELSRLTSKGQITIPKVVRDRLKLNEGDRIAFVEESGGYLITKASTLHFNRLANKISQIAAENNITEEDMLAELERVREEMWRERQKS